MTTVTNPFTQRERITDPQRFVGRWQELSIIFERLETRRPVLIAGPPGIGKSSLLTHIAQSAAITMERPDMESLYVDLSVLSGAADCYRLIVGALGSQGDTSAAFELALVEYSAPVLLCLDGSERAIAAGWGEGLLEGLARIVRRGSGARPGSFNVPMAGDIDLLLVAAVNGQAPALSEPFAVVTLGSVAPTEVRLLADAYLADTDVSFTPAELRELAQVSAGHPAYLQRAAYHLFKAKTEPPYDWRAAYFAEARDQPVPGAPLPPAVFEGESAATTTASRYGEAGTAPPSAHERPELASMSGVLATLLPVLLTLAAWQFSRSWVVALVVLVLAIVVAVLVQRRNTA